MLLVVRTPATLNRLTDLIPALTSDNRLEVCFTVDEGSYFSAGLTERLRNSGALIVPWASVGMQKFDVAIAASDNTELHLLDAPVILIPHGAGYHRRSESGISGLRREGLMWGGEPVPHTLALAHLGQLSTVAAIDPRLAERALVIGDTTRDRLVAAAARRHLYRADDRRLVLIGSTWGKQSLFGRDLELAARLTQILPYDEFQLVMTLHPNVWAGHGELQVRAWLRPATDAGVRLLSSEEDWRPALVAADVVLSDHGSLTCYAAELGVPTALAADGGTEVVPGSPLATLRDALPRFTGALPDLPPPAVDLFAHPGQALNHLLERIYQILELQPTTRHRPAMLPIPEFTADRPKSFQVTVHNGRIQRLPVSDEDCHHLAAAEDVDELSILEKAAAIWSRTSFDTAEQACEWAAATLRRNPGARVACAPAGGELLAVIRDGGERIITGTTDRSLAASIAYRDHLSRS
ncbi:hypothetical protein D5S17_09925 [Pseudonocardiaceae bacterium YIM PH 21723]|nr:hypothetical protein D5S17_09925 [Pseudonocardiaceae bacterium YIM PH 21723]